MRPLRVHFGGCGESGPGPTCGLLADERRLTLWVDEPSADAVEVSIDGKRVTETPVSAEQGMRWTLEVPPGAAGLEVRRRDSVDDEPFSLALRTLEQSTIDEHEALNGEASQAYQDQRLETLAGLVERARRRNHPTVAAQWAHSLAFHYIVEARDLVRGRRWLDEAGALLPYEDAVHLYFRGLLAETRGDLGEALVAYQRALVQARALGAGLNPLVMLAAFGRTTVLLARTGDRTGAIETLRLGLPLARSKKINAVLRASFLNSAAWSLLILRASSPSPRVLLDEARVLLGDEPQEQDQWFITRLNLAYDALERGETSTARGWLDALEGRRLSQTDALWRRLLLARLERLEGALEPAHRRLEGMIADAERHRDHGLLWAARVEHARVLEQLDRIPEALAEYAEADLVQERMLLLLSVGDRERFLVDREAVAQRRTQLLLAQGKPEAALCVARLARTRALRSLDQRMRRDTDPETRRALDEYLSTRLRLDAAYDETFWIASTARAQRRRQEIDRERETNTQRFETIMRGTGHEQAMLASCDGLPHPAPGTVDLHYVQLDDSWVGFIVDGDDNVTARQLPDPSAALDADDSVRLGTALLGPFAAPLAEASRVRVMATGPLFGVAFHALPLGPDGRRLQDGRTVVYGIDLPRVLATSDASGPALVLEPPSNLVRAHEEAELTVSALRRRGGTVLALGDQDEADDERPLAARLLSELPQASWLHYVGHARSNGLGGWDSEMVLAADGTATFGVEDVLALPAVPPVVILSGCQTGVVDPQSHGGGMSLAHAFVLSGSQVVIATTEEVRDEDALALMRELYDALDSLDVEAVPRAMAEAQRRTAAADHGEPGPGPPRAWRSARAWVP